jgi:hypothetical protein
MTLAATLHALRPVELCGNEVETNDRSEADRIVKRREEHKAAWISRMMGAK